MLYCLGELPLEECSILENHLQKCDVCKGEYEQITEMLTQAKNAFPTQKLSPERYSHLFWAIKREIKGKSKKSWWKKPALGLPNRLFPTIATICLVVTCLGWYGMKVFRNPIYPEDMATLKPEEQMIVKELDFIRNLELLREMDTLQKLAQVVDEKNLI